MIIKKNWEQEFDLGEEEEHPDFWSDYEDSNLYAEDEEIKQSREGVEDYDFELSRN